MFPTIEPGERLLVSNGAPDGPPSRGDIVVVKDPREASLHSIKRVIGTPTEEVRLSDGMLFIDGEHRVEAYLRGLPATIGLGDRSWSLREDEYFVMGDNRAHSTDSRHHGPLDAKLIVGKAWFRCWPPGRGGSLG